VANKSFGLVHPVYTAPVNLQCLIIGAFRNTQCHASQQLLFIPFFFSIFFYKLQRSGLATRFTCKGQVYYVCLHLKKVFNNYTLIMYLDPVKKLSRLNLSKQLYPHKKQSFTSNYYTQIEFPLDKKINKVEIHSCLSRLCPNSY